MIDPKILQEFEDYLAKLVGESFDGVRQTQSMNHDWKQYLLVFGIKNHGTKNPYYELDIAYCAWQILISNSVSFNYLPGTGDFEVAKLHLVTHEEENVANVKFDRDDLSLLIQFENDCAFKLFHNKEANWYYELWVNIVLGYLVGDGYTYRVKDEGIIDGIWNS